MFKQLLAQMSNKRLEGITGPEFGMEKIINTHCKKDIPKKGSLKEWEVWMFEMTWLSNGIM